MIKKILFFGRENCPLSSKALDHLLGLGLNVLSCVTKDRDESFPEDVARWSGDYIFCFRSLQILPKSLLERAKYGAINFHPGSPEYPGSGCINFALYENSETFGVTAHLMTEKVDDGKIILCRRFQIYSFDNVDSLLMRTHIKLLDLFFDVTCGIALGGRDFLNELCTKSGNLVWSGKKRTINSINKLCLIDKNISEADLIKTIRATWTRNFPTKILLHGYEFILKSSVRN